MKAEEKAFNSLKLNKMADGSEQNADQAAIAQVKQEAENWKPESTMNLLKLVPADSGMIVKHEEKRKSTFSKQKKASQQPNVIGTGVGIATGSGTQVHQPNQGKRFPNQRLEEIKRKEEATPQHVEKGGPSIKDNPDVFNGTIYMKRHQHGDMI
jgi:hypothetical protein